MFTVVRAFGSSFRGRPGPRLAAGGATGAGGDGVVCRRVRVGVCCCRVAVGTSVGDASCAGADGSSGAILSQRPPIPPRFLLALLISNHLCNKLSVVLRAGAVWGIGEHVLTPTVRFFQLHRSPDAGLEYHVAKPLLQETLSVFGDVGAVNEREHDATDVKLRLNPALHLLHRFRELQQPGQREHAR